MRENLIGISEHSINTLQELSKIITAKDAEITRLNSIIADMQKVDDVLMGENERDAKRYRWIRNTTSPVHVCWYSNISKLDSNNNLALHKLDDAIDLAF